MKTNRSQKLLEKIKEVLPTEKDAELLFQEAILERQKKLDPRKFSEKKVAIRK